jgi:hypothetical protein
MTQDEIIEMARQAGFMLVTDSQEGQSDWYECFTEEIEIFAKLVAAKERKACADLCATWYDPMWPEHDQAGNELAKSIRARGEA